MPTRVVRMATLRALAAGFGTPFSYAPFWPAGQRAGPDQPSRIFGLLSAGATLTVTGQVPYTDTLLSLLWRPKLSAGWTFKRVAADGASEVQGGDILWTGALPPSPVNVQYVVQIPADASGSQQLRSEVETMFQGDLNATLTYPHRTL